MNRFFKNMKKKPTAVFHLITLDLIKCLLSDDVICISSCVCVCVSVCVIMLMTAFDSVCYFNHAAAKEPEPEPEEEEEDMGFDLFD